MKIGIDFNDPAPLYDQIMWDIKNKIDQNKLKHGDSIGSQTELSKQYNVSLITIKKALSNLVNEGILFTRVGKGTYVSKKTKKKTIFSEQKSIGLVLRDLNHPYFSMIVQSIEERAYELGYNLLLSNSSSKIDKEKNQINHFMKLGVDGLIIASLSLEYKATDYLKTLHDKNFPYVMVSYIHDPNYWYVGSDHELGGYIATEHLIKTGYTKIGYVHVGKGNLLSEVRKNGYSRALMEYNIPYNLDYIYYLSNNIFETNLDRFQLGYKFGKEFIKIKKKPESLFFYNDSTALGFIQAARESKMRIPEDIAIVGYDDTILARFSSIPLTTVHQPVDQIGKNSVDIIQKRIDKKDIGNRNILKPTLVIRESCGAKIRDKLIK